MQLSRERVREVVKRRIQAHLDAKIYDAEEITKEIFDISWNGGFNAAVDGAKK